MEDTVAPSTTKPSYDNRDRPNDVKNLHELKKIFSTKLSLPKFMSVTKHLTPDQRMLVKSMGFHHLLDLSCESVPRGITSWLAKRFDVKSRALVLPDASTIPITPLSIHRVLGVPNGGKAIPKKCDESVKNWVCQQTRCKGSTPTINELKALLTPDLTGDKFKIVFALFAVSSFLCPTSHGSASTDYYSAITLPDQISEYDWCSAVLDKITQSVEFYQKTQASSLTTTLGGCILVLVITYFELLGIQVSRDTHESPCLKFWSTEMVKAFEALDAKDDDHCNFGRLLMEDSREAPLKTNAIVRSSASKSTQTCTEPPIEPAEVAQKYKAQIARTFQDFQRDIITAMEPIVSAYSDKLYNVWVSLQEDSTNQQKQGSPGIGGSNSSAQPKFENSIVAGTTCTHNNSYNPTDKSQTCTAIHMSDCTHSNVQQTSPRHTDALKPMLPTKEIPASIDAPTSANQRLSSFLQLPSPSQDSSSNTISHATHPEITFPTDRYSTETSGCSDAQHTQIQLQPKITQSGTNSTSLFQSRQPSAADMTKENPITTNEFNFWGDGIDSDFEVKPTEKVTPVVTATQLADGCQQKKRPRSLNDAACHRIALERSKRQQQNTNTNEDHVVEVRTSTWSTAPYDQETHAANHSETTKLEGSSDTIPPLLNFDDKADHDIEQAMLSTCMKSNFFYNFTSQLVEKQVFKDIVDRIPFHGPSPRVVQIKKVWVDHKTFGLSMRVFGTVSKYTLDMMGQAVMAEQFEKAQQGLLPSGSWYRHILPYEIAKLFQANNFDPSNITKLLTEYNVAKMDLVFLPLHHDQFWYLVVANFRHGRFEVLCPNLDLDSIQCNAEKVIFNFKMTFKCAYPRFMLFNIFQMTTTFRSVICSKNHCDSGVFVMKLMQSHDGDKQHLFKAEDAKPLRECMAYYMLTHPLNEKYDTLVDTKRILNMHGVTVGWHQ